MTNRPDLYESFNCKINDVVDKGGFSCGVYYLEAAVVL